MQIHLCIFDIASLHCLPVLMTATGASFSWASILFFSVRYVIIIIIYSSRVFQISMSWWFFTGVWVTTSLLKSPGLVSVFRPSSAMPVVWIVSTGPPTSKSSRPFTNPLVTLPNAPITIGTIVTYMLHSFFNSLATSRYLSFFSLTFRFIQWSAGIAKSTILQILFLCWLLWVLVFWPG